MAQDTIAFLDALGVSSAHPVGWSDGAVVGLLVALYRPDWCALPDSRLEVVLEATHGLPMEKPDVLARLVLDYLAEGR